MIWTPEQIAEVCHEANRAIQEITRDPMVSEPWPDAPEWQRTSAIVGVLAAQAGATPEELHDEWCAFKRGEMWEWGVVKDAEAKTHPCLVPYADLPDEQRAKDAVFGAIVAALTN